MEDSKMSKIVVIGLGPGDIGSLTIGAVERISDGNKVFLRTEKHPTVNYLKNKGIHYESYDYVYDEKQDFEQVYNFITETSKTVESVCLIVIECGLFIETIGLTISFPAETHRT